MLFVAPLLRRWWLRCSNSSRSLSGVVGMVSHAVHEWASVRPSFRRMKGVSSYLIYGLHTSLWRVLQSAGGLLVLTGVGRLVGDIPSAERLRVYTYLTPGHGDDVGDPTSWARMMWAARSTVVRDTLRDSHTVAEIAIIRASAMTLRSIWLDAQWVNGEISFTVAETSLQALRPIISKWSALRVTLCDEWLHYASLDTSTWLRSATMVVFKAYFLACEMDQCSALGDVI
uniref:Uncharacterized protein n=1 Tax=Hyaloperonospora arabidopsidis (strain Emoy2) TaxID=559515 RepID=M4C5F8_HYAAE